MRIVMLRNSAVGFALSFFGLGMAAQASVQVTFNQPERYTDAEMRHVSAESGLAATLRGIDSHLQYLGERYLPADHQLKVEILDIDLAGRFEPGRPFAYDVRMMRTVTWPRIKLRYTLENSNGVLASGEETIRDMDYLKHANLNFSHDELRFEKAMLDEWFLTRIGQLVPPGNSSPVSVRSGNW